MRVGLDLYGLLDERPDFFSFLTAALRAGGHLVAVLTYRDPDSRARTEAQLAGWGIVYDELHFAGSLSDKGRLCRELDIDVYFDDQDERVVGVSITRPPPSPPRLPPRPPGGGGPELDPARRP